MKTASFKFLFFVTILFTGVYSNLNAQISDDLVQFGEWLSGTYSVADGDNIEESTLCITRIWNDKPNGVWMYFSYGNGNEILNQEIYFISEITDGEYSMDKYQIKKPEATQNGCKEASVFVGLTPFDLSYNKGCTMYINYDGFQYGGMSNTGKCQLADGTGGYMVTNLNLTTSELSILVKRFDENNQELDSKSEGKRTYTKQ